MDHWWEICVCETGFTETARGELEALLCILLCIYSVIGAHPGVLQLSAAHEGIS